MKLVTGGEGIRGGGGGGIAGSISIIVFDLRQALVRESGGRGLDRRDARPISFSVSRQNGSNK